ncbi:MAG: hypothetical protein IJL76_00915 [Bacilli bacterium]|nr:hypothetical protein [Bacilli bacterium]
MTKSKIINIANKDNKYHKILFNKLEEKIGPNAPNFLNDLDSKDPNIIKEIIFITDNEEIEDMCFIKGYNDLKDCDILFDKNILLKETYLSNIEEYVKEILDMKTIKLHIKNPKDINRLSKYGYEDLGEVEDEIVLLKDVSEEIKEKRVKR